ncbi:protein of unknown function [Citrobacter amalonaticus]|uniref:Uncharacterized protein n=1 Tax=Citrobacter amalonaticus TaxID=35703 RepID=A0AAX2BJE8_CITAM|nr:protein of unknown function [Citrobacter amalonaticus]
MGKLILSFKKSRQIDPTDACQVTLCHAPAQSVNGLHLLSEVKNETDSPDFR